MMRSGVKMKSVVFDILMLLVVVDLGAVAPAVGLMLPDDLELVRQEGNYVTVREKGTGLEQTYYVEGEPVVNGWIMEEEEDSLIFEQVYYLDAFFLYKAFVHDFNGNGLPELFSADLGDGVKTKFLENQGDFNFVEVHRIIRPLTTRGFGDADGDGLFEILGQHHDTLILLEQGQSDSFPTNMVWVDLTIGGPYVSYARIGDIDGDSIRDITFLNTTIDPWRIELFENGGNNIYIHKPPIVWESGGPVDYASADFDGDGKNEIISAGAGHTGIRIFEYVENDSFAPVWWGDLGCPNPYLHESIGDNNDNGYGEWVSCGRNFSRSGFFFRVYEATGDNQYNAVYYDSLPGDCWERGGLAHGDVDGDGTNEFMVSANSNIGLYKYDPVDGWHLVWLCDQGGFATTYPFLLDVDNDGDCEIVLSGELLRVRVYNRVHTSYIISNADSVFESDIKIYPNPVNGQLKISINTLSFLPDIEIYDINGRLIKDRLGYYGNACTWDLRDNQGKEVSSGVYFIAIGDGSNRLVKRALILH